MWLYDRKNKLQYNDWYVAAGRVGDVCQRCGKVRELVTRYCLKCTLKGGDFGGYNINDICESSVCHDIGER
jgi:hypothetical protein